jgi:hypothetical protein
MANCPQCWNTPDQPCADDWDHLARYERAFRRGLVQRAELDAATDAAQAKGGTLIVSC